MQKVRGTREMARQRRRCRLFATRRRGSMAYGRERGIWEQVALVSTHWKETRAVKTFFSNGEVGKHKYL